MKSTMKARLARLDSPPAAGASDPATMAVRNAMLAIIAFHGGHWAPKGVSIAEAVAMGLDMTMQDLKHALASEPAALWACVIDKLDRLIAERAANGDAAEALSTLYAETPDELRARMRLPDFFPLFPPTLRDRAAGVNALIS